MSEIKIYINNDPLLRKRCKKLTTLTETDRKLFNDMLEIMYKSKGIGLAASQVGVLKQMLVVDIGSGPLKIVNPRLMKRQGKCFMEEGCLSLPNVFVNVKRGKNVVVEGQDEFGKTVKIAADNLLARVLQHELDHLNGVLIIDYLPWYKRFWMYQRLASKRP